MLVSFLISTFILLCATIIESSILSNITFLYALPDLVLICSIYFSLLNGKLYGETTGFISGIFLDFISGIPFGFNCLLRTVIGYIFGIFTETIIIKGFIIPMLTVGIGTIIKALFVYVIFFFFPNVNVYNPGLISYEFLYEFILNLILSPFIFKFLGFFVNHISIKDVKDAVDNA